MRKFPIAVIAAMLLLVPVTANAKNEGIDKTWDQYSDLLTQKGQNREPGPDGTFQGKPVVKGPANWHVQSGTSSTGSSTGEAGHEK